MKPLRYSAFFRRALGAAGVITLGSLPAQGANLWWDATGTDWSPAANWSTTSSVTGTNPASPPGSGDIAIFSASGLSGNKTVRLGGTRSALGLSSANQSYITTLEGGSGTSMLNLGTSGITHTSGGLTVGSTTPGQEVNIVLQGSQSWSTTTSFSGGALAINNNVSPQVNATLTLTGTNTGTAQAGAPINGTISDGTGVLSLTKTGTGTWALNGPSTYTGPTTISAGTLNINAGSTHGPGNFSVANGATLGLKAGGTTGFTNARLDKIHATGSFATGSKLTIETLGQVYSSNSKGDYALTKMGASELVLLGVTSRTGGTTLGASIGGVTFVPGSLRVRDLQAGGVPSSIGASSSDAANLDFKSGGRLNFDGGTTAATTTTDRLFTFAGTFTLDSSGPGALQFTNTGTNVSSGTGSRTVTLMGSNLGDNLIAGPLGANTNTSITKRGGGSWRISGANSFTGTTRNDGGTLIFDYANGDPLNTTNLVTTSGKTVLKGTGATTDTIPTLTYAATQSTGTHLKLEGGFELTANTFTSNNLSQRNDLIDLSGNAANKLNVGALGGTLAQVNGVIMANGSSGAGRANVVLRAPDGSYGFPALSGTTTGFFQKTTGLTQLSPGTITMTDNTKNFLLKQGTFNGSGNLIFGTLTFDSNDGPVTLNVGADELNPSGSGKAFLFTGGNNVTITGNINNTDAGDSTALWFHNYLESPSRLNLSVGLGTASQYAIFGGPGLTVYSGDGFVGNLLMNGGVFRFTTDQFNAQVGTGAPTFKVSNGAVLEVGARVTSEVINPSTMQLYPYEFTKAIGVDPGMLRLLGSSGFSAYTPTAGGSRLIAFCNEIPYDFINGIPGSYQVQNLTWGQNYFLVVPESTSTDGEYALKLSTQFSNATADILNPIALADKQRVVDVANGSAAIDARLSGELSGASPSGLVKMGPGTLQLAGVNTYKGETRVMEGSLRIDSASLDPASRLWIDAGATLDVTGTVHVASVFVNGVQQYGTVTGANITGTGTLISDAVSSSPYDQWVIDKSLGAGEFAPTFDADKDGIFNLMEYATGSEPKVPNGSVLKITNGSPRFIQFNHGTGRTDITFVLESSPNLGAPWTVIASSAAGAAFTSSVANVSASETAGTVTVTDSRTPAATVMFYRLRAEK